MHNTDLSLIVFGPIVLGLGLFFARHDDRLSLMDWALVSCGVPFMYSLSLLWTYDPAGPLIQCVTPESYRNWIVITDRITIEYRMGIDGISLCLVLLTTILTPIIVLSTRKAIEKNYREFLFALLALETGVLGCFVAADMILFQFFFVAILIPMFFIIGVWGTGDRRTSALRYLIFMLSGSALMLVGTLMLHSLSEGHTFNVIRLYTDPGIVNLPMHSQAWLFWAFFIAFAVAIPLFPLQAWAPNAHSDAPAAGSAIAAGVLLKLGAYGVLRFCIPMFPDASRHFAPLICILAVIGFIWFALVAIAQRDFKRLVVYLSISHMGLIVIGLFAMTANGIAGALLYMVSHGIAIGTLFLVAGMLYERTGSTRIEDYGGIIRVMPILGALFLIIALAAIGLPPLNIFASQFLMLLGILEAGTKGSLLLIVLGGIAATGIIWWGTSVLWMYQRVMLGRIVRPGNENLKDLNVREIIVLGSAVILIVMTGLFSPVLTSKMETSVQRTINLASREIVEVVEVAADQDADVETETDPGSIGFIESVSPTTDPVSGDEGGDPE